MFFINIHDINGSAYFDIIEDVFHFCRISAIKVHSGSPAVLSLPILMQSWFISEVGKVFSEF